MIPIPDSLDYQHAAAAPLVFVTAWHMLMTRARLQPGEHVLVLAGSSGVGMAAIQLAKWLHCRVIATAGSEEKMARCQELGADFVLNHYRDQVTTEVRRLTAKRGVDVVFGHVGPQPGVPGNFRPPGDVRRDHGLRRRTRSPISIQQAADSAGLIHGHAGGIASRVAAGV